MFIRNILSDIRGALIKGILLAAMVCMQGITRAEADICFLPSGECKSKITIQSESCKTWTATEREQVCSAKNGYVKASQVEAKESNGYICTSALSLGDTCCPGWYYCTEKNCQDQGFKLKTQLDPEYYICTPCVQGGDTYYRCDPKPCNYDPENPTASTLADVCTNTNGKYCIDTSETNLCVAQTINGVTTAYVWTASSNRKAGTRLCGRCEATTEPPSPPLCTGNVGCVTCKNNKYYWAEKRPGGCVTCTIAGNVAGKDYYCCQDITEYPVAGCTDDEDGACFTCEGPVLATGAEAINCYKKVPKKCGNENQYVDKSISGCYCRDYDYSLNVNPTSLNFTAAGGTRTVAVESLIATRTSRNSFRYDSETGKVGLCTVSDNASGTITVNCGINVKTTPSTSSFNVSQTPHKVTTTHPVLNQTVRIRVEGDTCSPYQFGQSCSQSGYVAEHRGKSVSGAADCYECVNDNCPSGYTKAATPSPAEGYDTTKTDHGSNCYKAKSCQSGCSTSKLSDSGCYNCSACGYAGQSACWSCSLMDTSCDASAGYVWSNSSCSCIASGCTTGDVSKQSVSDCGSGGSDGWEYTYSGMSGGKKCGICTPKNCTGNSSTDLSKTNSNYSCTSCYAGNTQKFTCTCNLTEAMCNASGKSLDSSTCSCKTCSDSCSSNGWVTSCTEGCSGDYKVTCTNKGSKCGSTCYVENKTYCSSGCSNGSCNQAKTCSDYGYETSCTASCSNNVKTTCTTQNPETGLTCYVKSTENCPNGCEGATCKGKKTCSDYGYETSCTASCSNNVKTTCTTRTPETGLTCYEKSTENCPNGCEGTTCKGKKTCSDYSYASSCTAGCSNKVKTTCTTKTPETGLTCYEKNTETCTYGCDGNNCASAKCSDFGYDSSCTPGCSNSVKTTCTTRTPVSGLTCYEKSTETCTYGCEGTTCKGKKTCSDYSYASSCTASCSNNVKTTCTTKTPETGLTCYEKKTETCTYGCSGNNCAAAKCSDFGYDSACTPGCSNKVRTTCTTKNPVSGLTCYEKSTETCTYGCSGTSCAAATCSYYSLDSSCTPGCSNSIKTTCTTKNPGGGLTCYEKKTETCTYGCSGNNCAAAKCSDFGYDSSCTPSCSNKVKTTCTTKNPVSGLTCYEKKTENCTYGCSGTSCAAAKCSDFGYDSSCTPSCSNKVRTTCTTKNPVSGLTCYEKKTENCTYGCSGTSCAAAKCSDFSYDSSCTPSCSNKVKTTCTTKNPVSGLTCYEKKTENCTYGCDGSECKAAPSCSNGMAPEGTECCEKSNSKYWSTEADCKSKNNVTACTKIPNGPYQGCYVPQGGGNSGGGCTAQSYKAYVFCTLGPTQYDPCPGGTGVFKCEYVVPSCAFSKVEVWGIDGLNSGNVALGIQTALHSSGATNKYTRNVYSCQLGNTCKFYSSGSTLEGTVSLQGNARPAGVTPGGGDWYCEYTKNK